jgi:8-oxo-dGTP pyrophosphatase MutT (NUDIX family)
MSKPEQKMRLRGERHRQYAALPIRFTGTGILQVSLLTSRDTRRWIIPNGPITKLSPRAAAAKEAYEEAGLEGKIVGKTPIGHYYYDKGHDGGGAARVQVSVFLLIVSRQSETCPDQAERGDALVRSRSGRWVGC